MERRKRWMNFFGCLSIMLLFAGCVEGKDGGITAWNLISLFFSFLCGWVSRWLNEKIEIVKKDEPEEDDHEPGQE